MELDPRGVPMNSKAPISARAHGACKPLLYLDLGLEDPMLENLLPLGAYVYDATFALAATYGLLLCP